MTMKIQFVDLFAQYQGIQEEIDAAIAAVIRESAFIRGPHVEAFERDYAALLGLPYCISCANGTDALYIAMTGLGVNEGDEVITSAHSWISTTETITQAGGRVVFVDADKETFTINPELIEDKISPRTRGIIPVHLYGQSAAMDPIMAIARKHNLWVLEDCAQAHFARYQDRYVGTFGVAATFSFYPGKNLGAMGDAGCIVTRDKQLAAHMTMYARHGGLRKGDHQIEGVNSRMDGLQAAILNVKLKHIFDWTAARQGVAARYDKLLDGVGDIITPVEAQGREHVYHLYVIRTAKRDALREHLKAAGIDTVLNYPRALPFLPAYEYLHHRPEDFPVSHDNQSSILSLPIYAEMTEPMIQYVVDTIINFYTTRAVS
jgi:dTDP-4-amino-4,6-dideoxygalactose transaminase